MAHANQLAAIENETIREGIPTFRAGDTVKVHAKIIEGTKERIQIFEGIVIKRHGKSGAAATFTVRKVSYNVGVERTFYVNSPRIDKIEIVSRGQVRRSRLFYLRPLRGKSARIKNRYAADEVSTAVSQESAEPTAPESASAQE